MVSFLDHFDSQCDATSFAHPRVPAPTGAGHTCILTHAPLHLCISLMQHGPRGHLRHQSLLPTPASRLTTDSLYTYSAPILHMTWVGAPTPAALLSIIPVLHAAAKDEDRIEPQVAQHNSVQEYIHEEADAGVVYVTVVRLQSELRRVGLEDVPKDRIGHAAVQGSRAKCEWVCRTCRRRVRIGSKNDQNERKITPLVLRKIVSKKSQTTYWVRIRVKGPPFTGILTQYVAWLVCVKIFLKTTGVIFGSFWLRMRSNQFALTGAGHTCILTHAPLHLCISLMQHGPRGHLRHQSLLPTPASRLTTDSLYTYSAPILHMTWVGAPTPAALLSIIPVLHAAAKDEDRIEPQVAQHNSVQEYIHEEADAGVVYVTVVRLQSELRRVGLEDVPKDRIGHAAVQGSRAKCEWVCRTCRRRVRIGSKNDQNERKITPLVLRKIVSKKSQATYWVRIRVKGPPFTFRKDTLPPHSCTSPFLRNKLDQKFKVYVIL